MGVDYHSRFFEVAKLQGTDSEWTTEHYVLKSFFGRNGIPEVVMSDSGPQYAAETFRQFVDKYGLTHVSWSPRYPQSKKTIIGRSYIIMDFIIIMKSNN